MKKYIIIFSILLFLSCSIIILPSMAQPKSYSKGIYTPKELNLSPNTSHTIQNNSPDKYAFVIIFDSNEVVQQTIQLEPKSEKYQLETLLPEFLLVIVGEAEIIIS